MLFRLLSTVFSIFNLGIRLWWVQEGQVTNSTSSRTISHHFHCIRFASFCFSGEQLYEKRAGNGTAQKEEDENQGRVTVFLPPFWPLLGGNFPWTAQVSACRASKTLTVLFLDFLFKDVHIMNSLEDRDRSFSRVKGRHACNPP